ncbi:MAG: rod shape-determining protein MreC [Betaproteobacteria bacterium RIFCSPLOWO2_12_FULL_62_13]|nr:MAG: rod shape-determining protein MreC [Betaproteobacteria bacterium RIFCSPLOWO2_12_FULL_62_13]
MEHQPPPFFKTGPTPFARLLIFALLSLALLVADARFKYLDVLRAVAAVIIYPLQRIAGAPASIARRAGEFFVTHSSLREENARLTHENLGNAALLQQLQSLQAENAHLRGLLATRERVNTKSVLAEVLYAARDPFSRKIVVDRGFQQEVKSGQPVIDHAGVVGQVTRVYPWLSEVTLITDKDHLVPVLNVRNGLRAVLAGTGNDSALELRFVPLNADFQNGDRLVTSGIDGVYPPGLPVAEVSNVERNAAFLFARITCKPLAGVNSHAQVLIVSAERDMPQRPPGEEKPVRAKKSRKGG